MKGHPAIRSSLHQSGISPPTVFFYLSIAISLVNGIFLITSHSFLDNRADRHELLANATLSKLRPKRSTSRKFLVFDGDLTGQGAGNIVSGLLAAHLLGNEFHRVVCPLWPDFEVAFERLDDSIATACRTLIFPTRFSGNSFFLLNFMPYPPDECKLKAMLQSDLEVVFMRANTYPRWPRVPYNFFFTIYQPRRLLLDQLPYDFESHPQTVVHLRAPDHTEADQQRIGLDEATLTALEKKLPPETHLVTNEMAYYERFERCCGWRHSNWTTVIHSATGIHWGERETGDSSMTQTLMLWIDWYTIAMASTVYHTGSDFSVSAVHWTNKRDSHLIRGVDEKGQLVTTAEYWWRDGESTPLVYRTKDGKGLEKLERCGDTTLKDKLGPLSEFLTQQQKKAQQELLPPQTKGKTNVKYNRAKT